MNKDIEINKNMNLGAYSPLELAEGEVNEDAFINNLRKKPLYAGAEEALDDWDDDDWDDDPLFEDKVKITESQLRKVVRNTLLEVVKEKAVSKSQQRFFGMVDAYKKGEMPDASPAIKKAADGMTKKQVKDFAKTKHKGLPNHVDENTLVRLIRESIQEHLVDVMKRYTEGKATSKEANKAIMDLANSSNSINERKNRSFYDYADEYMKKNGKKLPDEILKNAAKKNDERFFNRKNKK